MKSFETWWSKFEPQIDPSTYNGNENEVRKAIGRCTWGAALDAKALDILDKNTPTNPQPSEPDKVKSLAQYLFEHDCEYADVRSSREYFQQSLDAYESTEQVNIRIERV